MERTCRVASLVLLACLLTASTADAQCAYAHPRKAARFRSALTQAMVPCGNVGGNTPNVATEGGVPACKPPETFNEEAGSQENGWVWGPQSYGFVTFKASSNQIVNPLNPLNTQDLIVSLQLKQIFDAHGAVSQAPGTLETIVRATIEDRAGGDMTAVDEAFTFDFALQGGQVALKTSVNALLNANDEPGLPGCASIEILSVRIADENGNTFAVPGVFLPDL